MSNQNLPSFETLSGQWVGQHIFHIQLNRPAEMNAMNPKLFEELPQAFDFLGKQGDLRVVVLTGNGKNFCAGLDLKEAAELMNQEGDDIGRKAIKTFDNLKWLQYSTASLSRCRVPVIVGVHGVCVGGGIDLISSADIRYCSKDAKFTIKEVDIGICADLGTVQRLPQMTGNDSLLRELNFTGRFFGSDEALKLGLVSKVSETREQLLKDLLQLAEVIASKSPVAVWTIKQAMNHDLNKIVEPNVDYMARTNAAMLLTTDVHEAVSAFLTKQKPNFPKL